MIARTTPPHRTRTATTPASAPDLLLDAGRRLFDPVERHDRERILDGLVDVLLGDLAGEDRRFAHYALRGLAEHVQRRSEERTALLGEARKLGDGAAVRVLLGLVRGDG